MNRFIKRWFDAQRESCFILMYHRIAHTSIDPWDLCVSPANFEDQLIFLKQNFKVIPMHELAERVRNKQSLKDLVAITFDDGYLDNFTQALPLLKKYGLPATFYFTTKFRSEKKSYWWDELEQIILTTPVLPQSLTLDLTTRRFIFDLGEAQTLSESLRKEICQWRYGHSLSNNRLKLFFDLWAELKPMPIEEQQKTMYTIKEWAGVHEAETPKLMQEAQVEEMASEPHMEVGAHTANHPALGFLPVPDQHHEVAISKSILEEITGKPVVGFAYPYGSLNNDTPGVIKTVGFRYAVSTCEQKVTHQSSAYDLPRFQVKNTQGKVFKNVVKAWQ